MSLTRLAIAAGLICSACNGGSGVVSGTDALAFVATPQAQPPAPTTSAASTAGPVCPVATARFTDTWGAPRSGGRQHKGVDRLAPTGTPILAPVAGDVTHRSSSLGGLGFYLEADDGRTYFGTHLSRYGADGRVSAGTVIGYVGDSGNAAGTPHLHFEVQLPDRGAVNPTPYVREWCG